jgi:hypothetical protein
MAEVYGVKTVPPTGFGSANSRSRVDEKGRGKAEKRSEIFQITFRKKIVSRIQYKASHATSVPQSRLRIWRIIYVCALFLHVHRYWLRPNSCVCFVFYSLQPKAIDSKKKDDRE